MPSSGGLRLSGSALLEGIRVWMYRAEAPHQSTSLGKNREVFLHKTTPEPKAQARNSGAATARHRDRRETEMRRQSLWSLMTQVL